MGLYNIMYYRFDVSSNGEVYIKDLTSVSVYVILLGLTHKLRSKIIYSVIKKSKIWEEVLPKICQLRIV
jgi:hypothetical protein